MTTKALTLLQRGYEVAGRVLWILRDRVPNPAQAVLVLQQVRRVLPDLLVEVYKAGIPMVLVGRMVPDDDGLDYNDDIIGIFTDLDAAMVAARDAIPCCYDELILYQGHANQSNTLVEIRWWLGDGFYRPGTPGAVAPTPQPPSTGGGLPEGTHD